ncbi:MAG TPA: cyclophilin-like family protein [Candidatus Deferrimicrobium sp.]|nr:cyclophilin-like family protein [Candidatus Deferrimicrobium sp.]
MEQIRFITPLGEIIAELRRDLSPRTVENILKALPMKYKVIIYVWGEEIFFFLPDYDFLKTIGYENALTELEISDVAFWPKDHACCLFFGKTPMSIGNKPVAAEPVNVFAKIIQGFEILPKLKKGDLILMEKI